MPLSQADVMLSGLWRTTTADEGLCIQNVSAAEASSIGCQPELQAICCKTFVRASPAGRRIAKSVIKAPCAV